VAEGLEPLSHQWYLDGSPFLDGPEILGSTTANLTVDEDADDIGSYTVEVSDHEHDRHGPVDSMPRLTGSGSSR